MSKLVELESIARRLAGGARGILAADESNATMGKRLESVGVNNAEENRRAFRELLFSAPDFGSLISGVILYDETIRQKSSAGVAFPQMLEQMGVIPGIKVDTGAKALPGSSAEKITEGLDGLRDRLVEYYQMGARFAKWRAVIEVDSTLPSDYCLLANAQALARYAALCQENGIVPIVEPEVLMDGDHDIERCAVVTERTLHLVFQALYDHRVLLEGILLKPNMVIAGKKCARQASVDQVAAETLRILRRTVPAAVPGIVFLSGGQSDELATAHLSAMNAAGPAPWLLSFSYGRALQAAALKRWAGQAGNVSAAQAAFAHRARMNSLACKGEYRSEMEKAA